MAAQFVKIPNLLNAGLDITNEPRTFFRRPAFNELVQFVDETIEGKRIGLIDGLPGTGKSSTLWWALLQPNHIAKSVAWLHFDRGGKSILAYAKKERDGTVKAHPTPRIDQIGELADADILVMDGVNHNNYLDLQEKLRRSCRPKGKEKPFAFCGFLTMSNKILREHDHTLAVLEAQQREGEGIAQRYRTQHSWSLEEYLSAFVQNGIRTELFTENISKFEEDWDIGDDGGQPKHSHTGERMSFSVAEVITQKYAYAGGSARWMMKSTVMEIDNLILGYIRECAKKDDLLSFALGPESTLAKTHLLHSSSVDGDTVYSIVSERATLRLVEDQGDGSIRALYQQAAKMDNPAFLGWVIEAGFFHRCKQGNLSLKKLKRNERKTVEDENIPIPPKPPAVFDYGELLKLADKAKHELAQAELAHAQGTATGDSVPTPDTAAWNELCLIMAQLTPAEGEIRTCKPSSWNQGGFDVVFVQTLAPTVDSTQIRLIIRFGQVTKSITHSLKLKYFSHFIDFVKMAGYHVEAVEIGFVVPESKMKSFRVRHSEVESAGLLDYIPVYGTTHAWRKGGEEGEVEVYGLDMKQKGYPIFD